MISKHLTWCILCSVLLVLAGGVAVADGSLDLPDTWDLYSDTWVGTDALGRKLPDYYEVGPVREDKYVGILYYLWLGLDGRGPFNITEILEKDPDAVNNPDSPLWGPLTAYHHWAEPLFGYYVSLDPWVIRKHAQMLADAGVDTLIFDVSNYETFQVAYMKILEIFSDIRSKGGKTPQIMFMGPFWDGEDTIMTLYSNLYSKGLYSDLWFMWDGKPVVIVERASAERLPEHVKDFFTIRYHGPGYSAPPSGYDEWQWIQVYPQHGFSSSKNPDVIEQTTVSVAQNAVDGRLAYFSHPDSAGRSYHNGKQPGPDGQDYSGRNFAEQWERALELDPQFLFITQWNEWVAMRLEEFWGWEAPVVFVDNFNVEYSRDIEPMKGGHGDNYYMQMIDGIRRFKGVREPLYAGPSVSITVDGEFSDWDDVSLEFRDTFEDVMHRNFQGYGSVGRLVDTSGRNDFLRMKVTHDDEYIYFYASTVSDITPYTDRNWMMLLINTDGSSETGWAGYDFIVNRKIHNITETIVEGNVGNHWDWKEVGVVQYAVAGNELEIAIPRAYLGLDDINKLLIFDFKWVDNMQAEGDILDFYVSGDVAPNGRFNYRYAEERSMWRFD